MTDIKTIKKLGEGYSGSAYLATVDKKKCILKKTHIDNENICGIDDEVSRKFNEIAKLHPDHFMTLISRSYIFEYSCEHKMPEWIKTKKDLIKEWKTFHNINQCLQTIYQPVLDGTLSEWYNELNFQLYRNKSPKTQTLPLYSMLLQVMYCFYIMEKNNWLHCDAHSDNIMYIKTKDETNEMTIGNNTYKIPTYKKIWYLIDYDSIYHPKIYNAKDIKKDHLIRINKKNPHHFQSLLILNLLFQPWWSKMNRLKLIAPHDEFLFHSIITNKKTKYIKDLLPKYKELITLCKCSITLCIMLEPEEFLKYLGLDINDCQEELILMKTKQAFSKKEILFLVKNLGKYNILFKNITPMFNK
jgi:hypothetical protein